MPAEQNRPQNNQNQKNQPQKREQRPDQRPGQDDDAGEQKSKGSCGTC